ncbi:hypothetical protein ACF0H5_018906 [Mactra antiquata]
MFRELDLPFSRSEVLRGISELNLNKSAGPDGILNEFLLYAKIVFRIICLHCSINFYTSDTFQRSGGEGYIVPIHKSGDPSNVNNFRGITLLSVIGKLFTRLINSRLTHWAENYYIYVESQAGFISKMGTIDNIFVLHGLVNHLINDNKQLFCAFVDYSKAFDYPVRQNIWYKLHNLGIRGKLFKTIKSMYSHITSQVRLNNNLGEIFESNLGVRQGESLTLPLCHVFERFRRRIIS